MSRRGGRTTRSRRSDAAFTDSLQSAPVRAYRGDATDTATNFDWLDRTGNGGTLRQASGSPLAMPTIVQPAEIGGRDALRFDGSDDFLQAIDLAANYVFMVNGSPFTMYTLLIPRGALVAGESIVDLFTSGVNTALRLLFGGVPSTARLLVLDNASGAAIDANVTSSFVIDTPVLLSFSADDGASPEYAFKKNGVLGASGSAVFGSNNPPAPLNVGRRANGTAFGQFDMAELLLYDRILTSVEEARLLRYFTTRYGTP